jgi:hypothetical protein
MTSILFFTVPIVHIDGFRQMAKWNSGGLDCVSSEQEHKLPILDDRVERHAKAIFALMEFECFHN